MMSIFFLILAACCCGTQLLHRIGREKEMLLVFSMGPLQGLLLLTLTANFFPYTQRIWLGYAFLATAALLFAVRNPGWTRSYPRTPWAIAVAVTALLIGLYTHYAQLRFLDTDNWIHEPLIASYMRGVFPPVHPFFPDIRLHGHYGRDLLMAFLTPPLQDPLITVWIVNVMTQVCAFLGLFAWGLRNGQNPASAYWMSVFVYFGICVGVRVGMIDTFDGNNGLVYAYLVLLFFHLERVLEWGAEVPPWAVGNWALAGISLGAYQIVYESHFGLLFLTGLSVALLVTRHLRAWTGLIVVAIIALGMAFTEGGPFTDLRRNRTEIASQIEQNKGQHVSVKFPKERLFQVLVTTAEYQRVSVAYQTALFKGLKPRLGGEGYMYIWDPRFLYAHWLPLYLAPFTLYFLRNNPLGLAFWFFGFWAYLTPALVDFGPLFELEYFRWEFAAGWGWAAALGATLGHLLSQPSGISARRAEDFWQLRLREPARRYVPAVLLTIAGLVAGERLLNEAILDLQRTKLNWLPTAPEWRLQAGLGVTQADLAAMRWLAPQVLKGERVLSNLGSETPAGLWPDCVLATLTGASIAGHDHPAASSRIHAHPNYDRDALYRAFFSTGQFDLLYAAGIRYLFIDPSKAKLNEKPQMIFQDPQHNVRHVYVLQATPTTTSAPTPRAKFELKADPAELRRRTRYPVQVTFDRPLEKEWIEADVLDGQGQSAHTTPLAIRGWGRTLEHSLVTPLEEGSYVFVLRHNKKKIAELPFKVDLLQRVAQIQPRLDLPDSFEKKRFYSLRLGLTSPVAIKADHEFSVAYRLKEPRGDYFWDMDQIPQQLTLNLKAGQELITFLQFLTPARSSALQPEIVLIEKQSGETIPLHGKFAPVRIP